MDLFTEVLFTAIYDSRTLFLWLAREGTILGGKRGREDEKKEGSLERKLFWTFERLWILEKGLRQGFLKKLSV